MNFRRMGSTPKAPLKIYPFLRTRIRLFHSGQDETTTSTTPATFMRGATSSFEKEGTKGTVKPKL